MNKKLTDRQQIKLWIEESNIIDNTEKVLEEIFTITMDYKKDNPSVSLRQAYNYAYISYIDKIVESR